jgi:cell division protein FtsL
MNKFFYLFNTSVFILIIYLLFKISYKTNDIKTEIISLQQKINKDKDDIRILQAEWTYLSNPKRIRDLSNKYLNNKLQSSQQLKRNESVLVFNDTDNKKSQKNKTRNN